MNKELWEIVFKKIPECWFFLQFTCKEFNRIIKSLGMSCKEKMIKQIIKNRDKVLYKDVTPDIIFIVRSWDEAAYNYVLRYILVNSELNFDKFIDIIAKDKDPMKELNIMEQKILLEAFNGLYSRIISREMRFN